MKRIKVLQLQPDYNVKIHAFADLAEQINLALPPDKFEVVSAYLSGAPGKTDPVSIAERSVYFEFKTKQLKGLRLKALWQLYKFLKKEQFDVIVANRFKPISMLLLLQRWLPACLCVGVIHRIGDFDRSYRQRQVKMYGQKNWVFVGVSDAVRDHLLEYECGFTLDNTIAITNAIDVDQAVSLQLSKNEARHHLDLPMDAIIIGALGRLVSVKGHTFLIEAFARLSDKYPRAHLAIIGEGKLRKKLERQIEVAGVSDRVHLAGFRPDALRYVKAFDMWVMPSLAEGLGLALLEGMSGRLPVIASNVPAMKPLIEGAGGIAVKPADVNELTEALDLYLSLTPNDRELLGDKAFEYLVKNHSIENYHQSYRALVMSGVH